MEPRPLSGSIACPAVEWRLLPRRLRGGRARKVLRRCQQMARSWNDLHNAESFFSRIRRAEIGHHHHVAGPYLVRYAQESAWREDRRRQDNGRQVEAVAGLAMGLRPSVDWCGYWQRAAH
jgi:hypothetical protein